MGLAIGRASSRAEHYREQRAKAIIDKVAPRDVITGPTRGDQLKTPTGLPASELNTNQRRLLVSLIDEYAHNYEHNIAHIQMDRGLLPSSDAHAAV